MPFGLVTQRQLDQKAEELRREIADASGLPEDIVREWNDWYTKFSALYARLRKQMEQQEKAAAPDEAARPPDEPPSSGSYPAPAGSAHLARRFKVF